VRVRACVRVHQQLTSSYPSVTTNTSYSSVVTNTKAPTVIGKNVSRSTATGVVVTSGSDTGAEAAPSSKAADAKVGRYATPGMGEGDKGRVPLSGTVTTGCKCNKAASTATGRATTGAVAQRTVTVVTHAIVTSGRDKIAVPVPVPPSKAAVPQVTAKMAGTSGDTGVTKAIDTAINTSATRHKIRPAENCQGQSGSPCQHER
jgi:hypothetical protein